MEVITYTVTPEEDGVCVRHILKAKLHFSTHAVARLTRAENGIRVNGIHARTVDPVHTGDVVAVRSDDLRPPKLLLTPGNWPLPIVYEDEHLLILNKPAGMTAHASNFLPDTPTVAGALAYQRGADHAADGRGLIPADGRVDGAGGRLRTAHAHGPVFPVKAI